MAVFRSGEEVAEGPNPPDPPQEAATNCRVIPMGLILNLQVVLEHRTRFQYFLKHLNLLKVLTFLSWVKRWGLLWSVFRLNP